MQLCQCIELQSNSKACNTKILEMAWSAKSVRHSFIVALFPLHRDIAVMNSDGTIEIRGRAADRIRFKVDRKAVWPSPIEEALKTHPSIREVKARIL